MEQELPSYDFKGCQSINLRLSAVVWTLKDPVHDESYNDCCRNTFAILKLLSEMSHKKYLFHCRVTLFVHDLYQLLFFDTKEKSQEIDRSFSFTYGSRIESYERMNSFVCHPRSHPPQSLIRLILLLKLEMSLSYTFNLSCLTFMVESVKFFSSLLLSSRYCLTQVS